MAQKFNVNGREVIIDVPAEPSQFEGEQALTELRDRFAPDPEASELLATVFGYMARMQAANVLLAFLHQDFLVEKEPRMNKEMVWDQYEMPLDPSLIKTKKKLVN